MYEDLIAADYFENLRLEEEDGEWEMGYTVEPPTFEGWESLADMVDNAAR